MMNNIQLATTAEFRNMSAQERVDIFAKFTNKTNELSGEMLEIMFQKKDYQDLGYNNWNTFVTEKLPIGLKQSLIARKEYKNLKIPETESFLKETKTEAVEAIEAELATAEFSGDMLSSEDIQKIKNECVPTSHHNKIKNISGEEALKIKDRVDTGGKKKFWRFYVIIDDIFNTYLSKEREDATGVKGDLTVTMHNLEGLEDLISSGRDVDQDKWLSERRRVLRKDVVDRSGHKMLAKDREEAEERRIAELPSIIDIEDMTDLAKKVALYLFNDGCNKRSFNNVVTEEYNKLMDENK